MTFIPPWEKIIETKKCHLSWQEFFVTNKDLDSLKKVSPVFQGRQYDIPSPTLCPDERQKRRLCFRNERKLYKRKCDLSGKEIISIYSPEKPYVVYDQKVWWSDDWSPLKYGKIFDFEKGFFEQFRMLTQNVPLITLINAKSENCDYTNYATENKNCYLSTWTMWSENILYSSRITQSRDIIDSYAIDNSEHCYECIECSNMTGSMWCKNCYDSHNLVLCTNCQSCRDCVNCTNLNQKQFYVNNIFVGKDEFEKERQKILKNSTRMSTRTEFVPSIRNLNCEYCSGDNLTNCQHCHECFSLKESEYCKYAQLGTNNKYCSDANFFDKNERAYEVINAHKNNTLWFDALVWYCQNVLYSYSCFNANDLFWCVSLHSHEHHCILNTPYSVQEYETLCGKIIDHMRSTGEWWEFFPHSLSPFWYNETVASEYFPMTEEEVKAQWWNWYEGENKNTYIWNHYSPLPISQYDEKIVGYETATKNINEVLGWIIECEITGKPFKIIKQELVFYIENSLPIPIRHPDQRHKERMDLRNPRKLYERTCAKCGENIITTYAPDKTEKVVCEECYKKLVY